MQSIEQFKEEYSKKNPRVVFGQTHLAAQCICEDGVGLIHYAAVRKDSEALTAHWEQQKILIDLVFEKVPSFSNAAEFLPYADRWFIGKEFDTIYPANVFWFTRPVWFNDSTVIFTQDIYESKLRCYDIGRLSESFALATKSAPTP